ncbi:hypothetical protein SAMN05421858_2698 [Haladaptatus litoreus]|uniref:Uncharacterized protein n=1 Tax=Haladaptatus litoreus TaxID=553468 RepID=A0A1N7BQU9_9EURY|nr:hypothetical protein [Haladaptatus litoreus]SIR53613.1 hypothetical protein SAMN05421858_2698 [Haladaptatus litoreus]
MPREELVHAAEELKHASADASSDVTEQLESQAETLSDLAEADHGPDHGRLDRIMHSLSELESDADDETAERIQSAYDHVKAHRETVSGV